ncbi:MAG: hypothetical protein HY650_02475 [Acidobacteria bacterium]|nr:hypothetical protein [Acidobacteriota bacterium]
MNCGEARRYLYGGNVFRSVTEEREEAKRHASDCPRCRLFFATEERLVRLVKQSASASRAPASFRERLLARVAEEQGRATIESRWIRRANLSPPLLAIGISLLIIIISISALLMLHRQPAAITPDDFASIMVADHIDNLSQGMQITSSDSESVRKWFRERVDFSFRLPRTSDARLTGGRLCYLRGQRAALVVYQKPECRVSVFVLNGQQVELPGDSLVPLDGKECWLKAERGHNVVLWKERGLLYGLVSDGPNTDLFQLAAGFE